MGFLQGRGAAEFMSLNISSNQAELILATPTWQHGFLFCDLYQQCLLQGHFSLD